MIVRRGIAGRVTLVVGRGVIRRSPSIIRIRIIPCGVVLVVGIGIIVIGHRFIVRRVIIIRGVGLWVLRI